MFKRYARAGLALPLVVGLAMLVVAPAPALSAADTKPPTVTSPAKASFAVGGQIDVGEPSWCDETPAPGDRWVYAVPLRFGWSGRDASGPVRYSLDSVDMASGGYTVFENSRRWSYASADGTNFSADCGGPDYSVYQWDLTAKDPAGNAVTKTIYGGRVRLTQDSNVADRTRWAVKPAISYSSGWRVSRCRCWSDGGVHKTTRAGAAATITIPRGYSHYSGLSNVHVGLVMEKGPNRGRFRIFVDGALRTTVDLHAPTSQPRTIVWQTAFRDYGHRIRIVNRATTGRPRIDLDAVLTN